MSTAPSPALAPALPLQQRLVAALLAATLGLALLFVSGFAPAEVLHNAAHDWRHANNFPCH
jgi:cobalt transporter subunit CbtB